MIIGWQLLGHIPYKKTKKLEFEWKNINFRKRTSVHYIHTCTAISQAYCLYFLAIITALFCNASLFHYVLDIGLHDDRFTSEYTLLQHQNQMGFSKYWAFLRIRFIFECFIWLIMAPRNRSCNVRYPTLTFREFF